MSEVILVSYDGSHHLRLAYSNPEAPEFLTLDGITYRRDKFPHKVGSVRRVILTSESVDSAVSQTAKHKLIAELKATIIELERELVDSRYVLDKFKSMVRDADGRYSHHNCL